MTLRSFPAALLFLTSASFTASAQTNYQFTRISDPQIRWYLFSSAAMNNYGNVVFSGAPYNGTAGIYEGNGGALTTLPISRPNELAINDSNTVAFLGANTAGNPAIQTYSNGKTTTLTGPAVTPYYNYSISENNSGAVAFLGTPSGSYSGVFSLMVANGQSVTPIVSANSAFSGMGAPSLNNQGAVAFHTQSTAGEGVYEYSGGQLTKITAGEYSSIEGPTMNQQGSVAFTGQKGGYQNLLRSSANGLQVIASSSPSATGAAFNRILRPSINGANDVAFIGYSSFNTGIYITTKTGYQRVLGGPNSNWTFDGQTVIGAYLEPGGLNDNGQLLFEVDFTDGTKGLYRADAVPEPSALALLFVSGLAGTIFLRRRKRFPLK